MRIDPEIKLDFKDVLIRPKRSTLKSRSEVTLDRTFIMKNAKNFDGTPKSWTGVPIISSNMDTTGTFEMAKELSKNRILTAIHKHYSLEEWVQFIRDNSEVLPWIAISMGIDIDDFQKVTEILKIAPEIEMIMIDVANGYTEIFLQAVQSVHKEFPHKILIAGNVVTGEMTEELILNGVDIVKIGLGNGSACSTRIMTGVGYPQLSAIIECADAAHGLGGLIIGDGGCTIAGDLAKAFGAGADFVMLGGMFAGHDESGGNLIEKDGKMLKEFYGMSSSKAMDKHYSGVAKYRASEGKILQIPYKGPIKDTVQQILGGLRSACTYVGAQKLKELSKRTTFLRVRQQANFFFKE